jgi:hypothetical protein
MSLRGDTNLKCKLATVMMRVVKHHQELHVLSYHPATCDPAANSVEAPLYPLLLQVPAAVSLSLQGKAP